MTRIVGAKNASASAHFRHTLCIPRDVQVHSIVRLALQAFCNQKRIAPFGYAGQQEPSHS